MSKSEVIHELYEVCKDINIDEADALVVQAADAEEKGFIRTLTDYILQQKQKRAAGLKGSRYVGI